MTTSSSLNHRLTWLAYVMIAGISAGAFLDRPASSFAKGDADAIRMTAPPLDTDALIREMLTHD